MEMEKALCPDCGADNSAAACPICGLCHHGAAWCAREEEVTAEEDVAD